MSTVVLYTTPTCIYCKKTKEFLTAHNVQYAEFDVAFDEAKRNEMVERTGQMGVPVIIIDKEITIGFDRPRIASLLHITE